MFDPNILKRSRSEDSAEAVSVNLLESSPELHDDDSSDDDDDTHGNNAESQATRTLDMLSSQQCSQDDLMYDHSQRHVDAARVQQEQKEWNESQRATKTANDHGRIDKEECAPAAAHSPAKSNQKPQEVTTTTPPPLKKQQSPAKTAAMAVGKEDLAVGSDDETVDPDEMAPRLDANRTSPRLKKNASSSQQEQLPLPAKEDEASHLAIGQYRSKRVAQVDPDTQQVIALFPSISKAAEELEGIASKRAPYRSDIGRVAAGNKATCRHGFAWNFVIDNDNNDVSVNGRPQAKLKKPIAPAPLNVKLPKDAQHGHKLGKRVARVDANGDIIKIYTSYLEAGKANEPVASRQNSYAVSIGRAATGKRVTCRRGLTWRLLKETGKSQVKAKASKQNDGATDLSPSTATATAPVSTTETPQPTAFKSKKPKLALPKMSVTEDAQFIAAYDGGRALRRKAQPEKAAMMAILPTASKRFIALVDSSGTILRTFPNFSQAAAAIEPEVGRRASYRKDITNVVAGQKKKCRKGFIWKWCADSVITHDAVSGNVQIEKEKASVVGPAKKKKKRKPSPPERNEKHVSFDMTEKRQESLLSAVQDPIDIAPHAASAPESVAFMKHDDSNEARYCLNVVTIAMDGPLAMHVTQVGSPNDLREAINTDQFTCCQANRISSTGAGAKSGFREGDILMEKVDEGYRFWDYKHFLDFVRTGPRPLRVFVARKLDDADMESATALLALHVPLLQSIELSGISPSTDPQIKRDAGKQDLVDLSSEVVPFCKLCNGGNFREHHAWCPEHPHFHHNNAEQLLDRIHRGVQVSCSTCIEEYKTGRLSSAGLHSTQCQQEQERAVTESASSNAKRKREPKHEVDLSDIGTGADALKQIKKKKPVITKTQVLSQNSSKKPQTLANHRPSTALNLRAEQAQTAKLTVGQHQRELGNIIHESVGSRTTYWDADPPSDVEVSKVAWVPCCDDEDPWGFEGHEDGDVVLWSPGGGIGHCETMFPSKRFESDPFASYPMYNTTHTPPSEGLHILVLRRDPHCTLPWGFYWKRHVFGGACLVTRVEAYTSANVATFLGEHLPTATSKLRVNDMLLAINGVSVGGMTSKGLNLDLDVAGRELQLVISRFKQPSEASARTVHTEQLRIAEVDEALNDKSNLDWIDAFDIQNAQSSHGIRRNDALLDGAANSTALVVAPCGILVAERADVLNKSDENAGAQNDRSTFKTSNNPALLSIKLAEGGPVDLAAHVTATNGGSRSGSGSAHNTTDVSNGCICGATHTRLPVFWICCDDCGAWYCIAEKCAGLTRDEADELDTWLCLACDECPPKGMNAASTAADDAAIKFSTPSEATGIAASGKMIDSSKKVHQASLTLSGGPSLATTMMEVAKDGRSDTETGELAGFGLPSFARPMDVYPKDLVVYVKEHAWTGVDNPAGIAKILDSRIDEDGDRVYDIRYVVGGNRKNVMAEYICRHSWDHPEGW